MQKLQTLEYKTILVKYCCCNIYQVSLFMQAVSASGEPLKRATPSRIQFKCPIRTKPWSNSKFNACSESFYIRTCCLSVLDNFFRNCNWRIPLNMSCRGEKTFILLNLDIVETWQGILLILRIIEHNCVIVGRALHPSFYHLTKLTILTKLWSLLVQKLEIKFAFVPCQGKRCSLEGGEGKLLSKESANLKASKNIT